MSARIQKSLEIGETTIVRQLDWDAELEAKHSQVVEWLKSENLDGVLIRRNENVAWLTGGAVELRVLTPCETGVASLLVTAEGGRYYLTTNNEAPRLADEEFGALDFEPVIFPWYADATQDKALELAHGQVACDVPTPGFAHCNLYALRAALQETEIARLKWLGAQTGKAVSDSLMNLERGNSERIIEAQVAVELLRRGILPSVYLMAADERILKYKHAVARNAKIDRYAMINLCARRWGLTVSITRFVHFGAPPAELLEKFQAASAVNAALLDATREGATSAALFKAAAGAYSRAGFEGEEQMHHQGGATGYWEREWIATPEGTEVVRNNQAFAWNPSVRGGKVEDTVLLKDGQIELITPTPDLPTMESCANGTHYPASGILIL